jgi:O-antigen ligase
MQKINNRITFLALWILLLSTIFVVSPWLWNPTEAGKYFYFAVALGVSLPVAVFSFFSSRLTFSVCLTDVAIFCFVAWVFVRGAFGDMRSGMELWFFMLLLPLYLTIRISLIGKGNTSVAERIRPLLLVIVSATTVEAIWGFLQLYGVVKSYNGIFSISGSFFNPAPYSCFLACGVLLALYFMLKGRSKAEKLLGIVCAISSLTILPATMSRASWIAVLVGSLFLVYGLYFFSLNKLIQQRKSRIFKWLLATACVILVALFLAGVYFIKKDSANGRMLIWRTSTTLVQERPLVGSGFNSFQPLYCGAQASYFTTGNATEEELLLADVPEYAFNEYLQLTVEHGIIGLLLFLFVAYSFFAKQTTAANDGLEHAVKGSLAAFLVFAFFSYPFSVSALAILFVVLAAISASLLPPIKQFSHRWVGLAAVILCFGMTVYACSQILSRYTVYCEWQQAQKYYHAGSWKQAEAKYSHLYPKLNFQKHFLFEYALCLSKTGQHEASNEVLRCFLYFGSDPMAYNCMGENYKQLKDYEKAESMYLLAFRTVPNRHYPLYLLMKLYNDNGAAEPAKKMAALLLEKQAKVNSTAIEEMQEEARKILELQAAN